MPENVCAVGHLERHPVADARLRGLLAGQLDRLGVVVRADDRAARVRLASSTVDEPSPQPTSATLRARRQLRLDPVERRDPVGDQLGDVAGPVERVAADEDVLVVLVPAHARRRCGTPR